jgi:3-methyladenine DNA glycosylase AlkD
MNEKQIRANQLAEQLNNDSTKMGDIKKLGKEIKKDHELGLALWYIGGYQARMLATLIFDKSLIDQAFIDEHANALDEHSEFERNQIADWLLANQLMKSKRTKDLLESWQNSPFNMCRRLFWYHQARLRWTGQTPPPNSEQLLDAIEKSIMSEVPEVQWTMNFCAAQIGVHEPEHRERCITLGKTTKLYEDEKAAKNCTPSYLPEFIRIEVAKRS